MLILLNFSGQKAQAALPPSSRAGEILINNYDDDPLEDDSAVLLEPCQALVIRLDEIKKSALQQQVLK